MPCDGDVGNFASNGGAVVDGNADRGGTHRWCVVDAIAEHENGVAFVAFGLDVVCFVFGEHFGVVFVDADLCSNGGGGAFAVAREHDGTADAEFAQLFDDVACFVA